jgi:hypothetical protein
MQKSIYFPDIEQDVSERRGENELGFLHENKGLIATVIICVSVLCGITLYLYEWNRNSMVTFQEAYTRLKSMGFNIIGNDPPNVRFTCVGNLNDFIQYARDWNITTVYQIWVTATTFSIEQADRFLWFEYQGNVYAWFC